MKLKPLGSRLVVKPQEGLEKTDSGIIVPDTAQEDTQRGEVMAVGPGKSLDDGSREEIDVEEGDTVYYAQYGPTELEVEGEEVLVLDYSDVLAVVEE